jgi:hypothetical protein
MKGNPLRGKCFSKHYQLFILSPLVQEDILYPSEIKNLLKNEGETKKLFRQFDN